MREVRRCRRPDCERPVVATPTSICAGSTTVLGPLATKAQPKTYDLYNKRVLSFTALRGQQIIHLAIKFESTPLSEDDLPALADAVCKASRALRPTAPPAEHRPHLDGIMPASLTAPLPPPPEIVESEILRRGHLWVLRRRKGNT